MTLGFQELEILIRIHANEFQEELLDQLEGLIKIDSAFIQDSLITYDMQSTRYSIQKDITKNTDIDGWEPLIQNLRDESLIQGSKTLIVSLVGERNGYLIYAHPNLEALRGILRFKNEKVEKNIELTSKGTLRGTWTESRFFLNGKEVTN